MESDVPRGVEGSGKDIHSIAYVMGECSGEGGEVNVTGRDSRDDFSQSGEILLPGISYFWLKSIFIKIIIKKKIAGT